MQCRAPGLPVPTPAAPRSVGVLGRDLLDTSRNESLCHTVVRPACPRLEESAATSTHPWRRLRLMPMRDTDAKLAWPRQVVSCLSVLCRPVQCLTAFELALLGLACGPQPRPCVSTSDCPQTTECLANGCAPVGADPVSGTSLRSVLRPIEIAVVTEAGDTETLPSSVVFGGRSTGSSALYLRFQPPPLGPEQLQRAFLVLEPMPGAQPATTDVSVAAWRIAEPWTAKDLTWWDQPSTRHPSSAGIARTGPPQMLRIDVTDLIRHFQSHPRENRGVVLKAGSGAAFGATYCTGLGMGTPPALELYYRRRQPGSAGHPP
jgi:hypothetical protein